MKEEIERAVATPAQHSDDVCALPIVRRLGAALDMAPDRWREGDVLPRGWHLAFFSVDTPQSQLRTDGFAGLGVALPELGLPRIVFGGREIRFNGDISIGAKLRRKSRLVSAVPKQGRSGHFAVCTIEHEIFIRGAREAAVLERHDYIMREAVAPVANPSVATSAASAPSPRQPARRRVITPDELLLFRISAVMSNPHRIHYDSPYASQVEGYPALVVNASVASLLLLEFFRSESGHEPQTIALRHAGLAFCGRPLRLNAIPEARQWRVWADDEQGRVAVEGTMGFAA